MTIAFSLLVPIGKIFDVAPRTSVWGYWQIGALSAALVSVISAIGMAVLKQGSSILAGMTSVIALAAAYAFRRIYEVEAKDHAAADIKKAVDDQKEVNADEHHALAELRAQNDELQRSLQVRNNRVLELEQIEGKLRQDLAKAEDGLQKFQAEQVQEGAASAKLKDQLAKVTDQLDPLLDAVTKGPLGPQLADTVRAADGEEDKIHQDVAKLKAVVDTLAHLYQGVMADNQTLRESLSKLPKVEGEMDKAVEGLKKVVQEGEGAADELKQQEEEDRVLDAQLAHLLEQARNAADE